MALDLSGYTPIWDQGFNAYVGPFLYGTRADGSGHLVLELREEHMNGGGMVHGGLLMTVADVMLGKAVNEAADGAACSTMTLNTDFLAAGKGDAPLEATAEITRRTRSMVFVTGKVFQEDKILLTATGIWKILGAGK